jgi:hypothetical protein
MLVLEKKIFKIFQCIFTRLLLPSLKEGQSPLFEQTLNHSSQGSFCQVWLKMTKSFWRFLNDPTPFIHFCDYLSFEEDLSLYLNKLELPSSKDNLYQV